MPIDGTVSNCVETALPYPGSQASAAEILALADAYKAAANALFHLVRGKGLLAHAPGRLCALHSVELYLNAYLRDCGTPPGDIRAKLHAVDNAEFADTLRLRVGTREHLRTITEGREYLVARYAPDQFATQSELTRVMATVHEIGTKTGRLLSG